MFVCSILGDKVEKVVIYQRRECPDPMSTGGSGVGAREPDGVGTYTLDFLQSH